MVKIETPSPRDQIDAWNVTADHYDGPALSYLARIGARAVELAELAPGAHVIDAACGTGHASLPAAERVGSTGRVIGVDLAANLLELARAKAARRGIGNLELRLGDMQEMAYGDGQFDAVLCIFALFFVPDMVAQLRTFWRHLRPGGRLAVGIWAPEALEPARSGVWLPALRAEFPELTLHSAARDRIGEAGQLRATMAEAGIADSELIACDEVQRLESPESWWEILLGLGPIRSIIDRMPADRRARIRQANVDWVQAHGVTSVNASWMLVRATRRRQQP
jgi:SAM-dependent methyltransferase